jgi:hypothetical protein
VSVLAWGVGKETRVRDKRFVFVVWYNCESRLVGVEGGCWVSGGRRLDFGQCETTHKGKEMVEMGVRFDE